MSDSRDLEILLDRVLPNPMAFAERVLQQILERLANASPQGNPLSSVVGSVFEQQKPTHADETLSEQNILLAAALGACTCWGMDQGCPMCHGDGAAAWMPPDPPLFDAYVAPAVVRMSADRMTGTSEAEQPHPTGPWASAPTGSSELEGTVT